MGRAFGAAAASLRSNVWRERLSAQISRYVSGRFFISSVDCRSLVVGLWCTTALSSFRQEVSLGLRERLWSARLGLRPHRSAVLCGANG